MLPEQKTWKYMVEQYPNMWIAIKDAQMDGPDIVSGIISAVITDDEIIDYEDKLYPHRFLT